MDAKKLKQKLHKTEDSVENELRRKIMKAQVARCKADSAMLRFRSSQSYWRNARKNMNEWFQRLSNQVEELEQRVFQQVTELAPEKPKTDLEMRLASKMLVLESDFDDMQLSFEVLEEELKEWQNSHSRLLGGLFDLNSLAQKLNYERIDLQKRFTKLKNQFERRGEFVDCSGSGESISTETMNVEPLSRNERDTMIYNFEKLIQGIEQIDKFPALNFELRSLLTGVHARLSLLNERLDSDSASTDASVRTAVLRAVSSTHLPAMALPGKTDSAMSESTESCASSIHIAPLRNMPDSPTSSD